MFQLGTILLNSELYQVTISISCNSSTNFLTKLIMIQFIVHTNSEYSFLWNAAIPLLEKYTPSDCKIFWLSDTMLNYSLPSKFVFCKYDPKLIWSLRFKECLELVDSEYFIYLQEDWLLIDTIDETKVLYLIQYMKDNTIEFMMSYSREEETFVEKSKYEDYDFVKIRGHYMQPAIWDKKLFMKLINLNIPLKEYELTLANTITERANCYAIKYTKSRDVSIPTLYYPHMHAIVGGKWTFPKYPQLKALVMSYGINPTTRGVDTMWLPDIKEYLPTIDKE